TRFSRDWSSDVCSSDLGEVLRQLEDKVGAKLVYEETLKLTEEIYGKGSSKTAPFSIQLGALLQEEGDIEGAIRYYEQAGKAAERSEERRVGKGCGSRLA